MADRPCRTVPGIPGGTNRFVRVRASAYPSQPGVGSGIGYGAGETGHPRTGARARTRTARTANRRPPERPGFLAATGNCIARRLERITSPTASTRSTCRTSASLVALASECIISGGGAKYFRAASHSDHTDCVKGHALQRDRVPPGVFLCTDFASGDPRLSDMVGSRSRWRWRR
jgi:hypothetical protein